MEDSVGSINNGDDKNGYAHSYEELTHDEDAANNLKFSLAHYFSTTFVVFIGLLLTSTIVLFIWSNTSDGAWVSLQVRPVLPTDNNNNNNNNMYDSINEYFPFAFAKLNANHNKNSYKTLSLLLSELRNPNRNQEKLSLLLSNNLNITLPDALNNMHDISDLELNLNIFSFSLVSSVSDFWQAGGYGLSVLIAAFSGIWPYIKLILLGICWLIPMKQENREGIIIFLDQMGKFSFIDLFVSLYMIVSFYVSITKELEGYGLNIKVVVEPDIGLNTFVIGTAISMIYSHFFLFLDAKYAKPHINKLIKEQERMNNDNDKEINEINIDENEIEIINKNEMNNYHQNGPLFLRFLPVSMGGVLLRSVFLICIMYTLYGAIFSVFTAPVRYNITGLVGWAITNPIRSYSPWQIVTQVPTHTDEHSAAPALSFCLFLVIILFPILLISIILLIWYVPIKYKYLNYLNLIMQTCMAWSALDVFAIASIAASLELSKVSQWILNQNYASVCGPHGTIPNIMMKLIGKPVQCFAVDGYLVWGIWIVIAVSVCSWLLFIYTIQQLYQYKQVKQKLIQKSIADKTIFFFNH